MRRLEVSPADKYGLDRCEAAAHIGVGVTLFDEMVEDGRMPPPKMINSLKVWKRTAIEKAFDNLPVRHVRLASGEEGRSLERLPCLTVK